MVQSDVLRGTTQSGKVNAKWYLQRLKASAGSRYSYIDKNIDFNKKNSNDTIRVVRGTTATQGKHIPRVLLTSPTRSFEFQTTRQKSSDYRRSSSTYIASATSLKTISTINKISPSISEFNSNSATTINQKDNLSERRSSSGTLLSTKPDLIPRPPSTPVDPRCHRAYSSTINPISRETCQLLGPQLCSDCIEVQTRANLSPERLPNNLIRQRLSALAVRPFIQNEQDLTDDDLLKMINNQQIQMLNKSSNQINSSIISDDQYFDRLSQSFNQYTPQTEYYFKDLKDFSQKYRSNKYKRLLLSETPSPQSSNPIFKQSSFEKFDISPKYSFMKRASTIKPNLQTNATIFVSPKKSEQFYKQHRYLINYSPPLLLQTLQQNIRDHYFSSLNTNQSFKHSLINSRTNIQI